MGTHWYSPVKLAVAERYVVQCTSCGHIASDSMPEGEAAFTASRLNAEIEASFNTEGRTVNPSSLGLARRMRKAKRARR